MECILMYLCPLTCRGSTTLSVQYFEAESKVTVMPMAENTVVDSLFVNIHSTADNPSDKVILTLAKRVRFRE